ATYLPDGTQLRQFAVTSSLRGNFSQSDVAYAPDATFFDVTFRSDVNSDGNLELNQYDPNGTLLHTQVLGRNFDNLPSVFPVVAVNGRGDSLVGFQTWNGVGWDATYQVVHRDGSLEGHQFLPVFPGSFGHWLTLAVDPFNDNFIAAYQPSSGLLRITE